MDKRGEKDRASMSTGFTGVPSMREAVVDDRSNPQRPDIPRPLALLLRERRVIRKSLALFRLSYTGFWLISEPFKVYIYQLIAMGSDTSEVERATFATISRRIPLLTDRLSRSLLVDGLLRRFRSLLRL